MERVRCTDIHDVDGRILQHFFITAVGLQRNSELLLELRFIEFTTRTDRRDIRPFHVLEGFDVGPSAPPESNNADIQITPKFLLSFLFLGPGGPFSSRVYRAVQFSGSPEARC